MSHYTSIFTARREGSRVALWESANTGIFHGEWSGDHVSYDDDASVPQYPLEVLAKIEDGLNFLTGDGSVEVRLELTLTTTPETT